MKPLSHIYLYDNPTADGLDTEAIAAFLRELWPKVTVETRDELAFHHSPGRPLDIGSARVWDLPWPGAPPEDPSPHRDRPPGVQDTSGGVDLTDFYDAAALADLCAGRIRHDELRDDRLHIAFVDELLGVFRAEDFAFQPKVAYLGPLTLISASGIIEVPPRPEEYHFVLGQLERCGEVSEEDLDDLEEEFSDCCLTYGDGRLTDALSGYVLQAVAHHLTGVADCSSPECRLYDAPTQQELLAAQCRPGAEICAQCVRHLGIRPSMEDSN